MKAREITVVVLDWSGTVSDDRQPVYTANMALLAQAGKPTMTFKEWLPKTRLTVDEFLRDHGVDGYPFDIKHDYRVELARAKERGIVPTPYPDAHEALDKLSSAGITLVVLSSHPSSHLEDEAQAFGLRDFFGDRMIGDSSNKAAGLAMVMRKLRVYWPPGLLYVGDTVYDIRAAKEMGVLAGGMCGGYHAKERLEAERPDFLFNNLSEISTVVTSALA
jgi:phosphoglycolate phosphatase-like HAD superfamily hydrolase